jgi:hypothetical protein
MKKQLPQLAAFTVGAGCAALLLWMWLSDRESAQRLRAGRTAAEKIPPAAAQPASPAPSVATDPVTKALLAALQQILTRADTRAKEAVLAFKDDATYHRFLARAQKAGLTVVGQLDGLRTARVRYDKFSALEGDLLEHSADYAAVSANYLMGIPPPPAKEDRAALNLVAFGNRALDFLGASGDRSAWGRGVTVAVLDTGIMPDATFGENRVRYLDLGLGVSAGNGGEDGHGTAVAALAAGAAPDAPGVAPAANLLSIRVTDAHGTSDIFTVAQAIVAAADAGAKIINISLGGYATNATLDAAIGYATARGALLVAAAGNDQAAQLTWPAADPRVISVGAVDAVGQQVTFSNSGPQLSLTAPGYGVQTAWLSGQRALVDGTSVSAPLVSGALAAVLSQNPLLTPQQAAQLLLQTASDAGAPGDDPDFGHGILNVGAALNHDNPGYADTAIASHNYDAAAQQLNIVVQNRGTFPVAGLVLDVNINGTVSSRVIPLLAPGESSVVALPVDPAALKAAGTLTFATQLKNPPGLNDAIPSNNFRTSRLTAPTK